MKDQGLSAADSLLCAVLQGHLPAWPEGLDGDLLLMRSDYHGVAPHMHERMSQSDWPAAVLDALRLRVQSLAMWELRHHQYMAEAVAALAMAGAEPLVIKGTGLAYSLYTNPVLRPRADTDILISASSGAAAHMCLTRLGFRRASAVHGDFASYQATYQKAAPEGGTHALDLHWKINNS
ncbi:MAG TPA: nucleotidyltransferase family protein, partial [Ramlibacter sp.]|nr:nucleotidyltransferase family protein [Ramlibacter sp.]